MSLFVRVFIIIVPFMFVAASLCLAIGKDWNGVIVFGLGAVITSSFSGWLLFIARSQIKERIYLRVVTLLFTVAIILVVRAIIGRMYYD